MEKRENIGQNLKVKKESCKKFMGKESWEIILCMVKLAKIKMNLFE